ncbi:MAG TPA: rhombosortase [Methylomirabilota bacterium]|nr:rhombosortase [Methylomirabilota bacterium]
MTTAIARLKQTAGRLPGASLLLSFVALALWSSPTLSQWCEWDRTQPWQLWRWLTAHFCHWSVEHLAWDLVVFAVLGAICERHDRAQFLISLAVAAVAITLATCLFLPNLTSYRGLSGLDSTLFGWLAAKLFADAISKRDGKLAVVTAAFTCAFIVKLAFEWTSASTVFVSNTRGDFVPVPLAHAVGAVVGIAVNAISRTRCARRLLQWHGVGTWTTLPSNSSTYAHCAVGRVQNSPERLTLKMRPRL